MGVILGEDVSLGEDVRNHAKVVARAWADASFKESLLAEPERVLSDYGFDFAGASDVRVIESPEMTIEDAEGVVYFGIPAAPDGGLGDEDLTSLTVSGGPTCHTVHTTNTTASVSCAHCTGNASCGVAA